MTGAPSCEAESLSLLRRQSSEEAQGLARKIKARTAEVPGKEEGALPSAYPAQAAFVSFQRWNCHSTRMHHSMMARRRLRRRSSRSRSRRCPRSSARSPQSGTAWQTATACWRRWCSCAATAAMPPSARRWLPCAVVHAAAWGCSCFEDLAHLPATYAVFRHSCCMCRTAGLFPDQAFSSGWSLTVTPAAHI